MTTKTDTMSNRELIELLTEVRIEIARINDAAGSTVFNPTATFGLETVMREFGVDKFVINAIRNRTYKTEVQ